MNLFHSLKPVQRSKARVWLGTRYYRLRRYCTWWFGGEKIAAGVQKELLSHQVATHRSILLRQLKDVDMQLQHNKIINLKLAVKRIDGLTIQPGETFSFWRRVGKPNRRKGYVPGMVLHYGKYKQGIGGGLCQLTNLLYWMALHSPLEVKERHRHSYDVFPDSGRTQPFGSGATCSYNYLDLQLYNPTAEPFQLHVYLNEHDLIGEIRSANRPLHRYEVYEREHKITREYWGGHIRHNLIFRRIFNPEGDLVKDEYVTENHALMMYEPLLEAGREGAVNE
ncbi:vancomycin resistance protein VanW [Fontibacillus phaseoli]|uniref:Vancomycin resistance protein VanW n=1 Tax=Fontibacillus phaseoli TaxID=1416533 RepID=A0A369BG48_9BACL|nr:VanW family protein [Fontibacillus phaseoli]RCX20512.1 vancomycin resistance protein VanW [Fontibacillus phaseoli]